jgi:hypothetical protein
LIAIEAIGVFVFNDILLYGSIMGVEMSRMIVFDKVRNLERNLLVNYVD